MARGITETYDYRLLALAKSLLTIDQQEKLPVQSVINKVVLCTRRRMLYEN